MEVKDRQSQQRERTVTPPLTQTDVVVARNMARYSLAAYPHEQKPQGFTIVPVMCGQFSAIIVVERCRVTVAITGTDSMHNFITDAKCVQVPVSNTGKIRVHVGFKEGLDALWPLLLPWMERDNLFLTGHSLGGAIARQILLKMELQGMARPAGIVTVGEPRSVNRYGAEFLDDLGVYSRRWFNKFDAVPRVPLMTLIPPRHLFWHCNHSVWIDPEGGTDVDRPWYKRVVQDLRGLRAEYKARKGDPFVRDHSAALYVQAINGVKI